MVNGAPFLRKEWERAASPAALCRRQDRSLKFWCRAQPMRSGRRPSRRRGPRSFGRRGRFRKCDVFPECEVKGRGIVRPPQSASTVAEDRRSDQASEWLHGCLVRRRNHQRFDGHHGGRKPQNGMAKIGGCIFAPLTSGLSFSKARSQQSAVAALHQSESSLDQAFDLIPHLMRFPVPISDALAGQQDFGDFAMGSAVGACIRRAQGACYPSPAICRNRVWRRALRPAIEPFPQANTGTRPEFEVAVERKFDGVCSGDNRRFFDPNTMLNAAQV